MPKNWGGSIEPKADIVRQEAANSNAFLRPYLSVTLPEMIQPKMVPSSADETTHPNIVADKLKCVSRKELQPDMIAVS